MQGERRPDMTVLLDMDPSEGLLRARERAALDRFEQEELAFFDRVRSGYLARAQVEPSRWMIIDASKTFDEVKTALRVAFDHWLDHG